MPTGGAEMNVENISKWFKAGVCAVGMGSKLITKDILAKKLYNDLYLNTQDALRLVQEARKPIKILWQTKRSVITGG